MSALVAQLGVAAVSMIIGWIGLWPSRKQLGTLTYHLVAMPVGLLAWPIGGSFSTWRERPFDAITAGVGAVLLIVGLWVIQRLTARSEDAPSSAVSPLSFVVALGVLLTSGAVFTALRFTATNNDSVMSYWPLGTALFRDGTFTANLISVRALLIPSLNAGHVIFGSQWAYAIYSLFALNLVIYVAVSLLSGPLKIASKGVRIGITTAVVLFLVTEPSFLFHSVFVHSHMITALYLMLALGELWTAVSPVGERAGRSPLNAHLVVAGLSAAGLALARPDGLAYVFVPITVAISLLTRHRVELRSAAAFFAPMLYVVYGSFLGAFLGLGMWSSGKLGALIASIILFALGLSAAGPWVMQWLDTKLPFRVTGDRFLVVGTFTGLAMLVAVCILRWETAKLAALNASVNLFGGEGGYWYLWYAVVALLVVSVITRDATRPGTWTHPAFLAIMLFVLGLAIVHSAGHSGRVGVGDSLNRVVFHILPLIAWYAGAIAARIFSEPLAHAEPELAAEPVPSVS